MSAPKQDEARQFRMVAGIACLALGAGLVLWGVAPALTYRMATGRQPPPEVFVSGLMCVALGLTCAVLQILINGRARWPLWAAFGLALTLLTGTVVGGVLVGGQYTSAYMMFLAGGVVVTSWVALDRTKQTAPEPNAET